MNVQPGDGIRILQDFLQSADVRVGDVLTVTARITPDGIFEAHQAGHLETWWFGDAREGTGWERVADGLG